MMRSVLTLAILIGVVAAAGWVAASTAGTNAGAAQSLRLRGTPTCYLPLRGLAEAYTKDHPDLQIAVGGAVDSLASTT